MLFFYNKKMLGETLLITIQNSEEVTYEDKKNITLLFRGSENQRLIDVKKSLEQDKVVEWKPAIKRGL